MWATTRTYRFHREYFLNVHRRRAYYIGIRDGVQMQCNPSPRWWAAEYSAPVMFENGVGELIYGPSVSACHHRHQLLTTFGFPQYNRVRMAQEGGFTYRTEQGFSACNNPGEPLVPVLLYMSGPNWGYHPAHDFDEAAVGIQVPRSAIPMYFNIPRHFRNNIAEELDL